jgi:DNA-binding NarL/FixJ family response regulator
VLSGLPLDRNAIRAVLDTADAPPPALPAVPADLTERELDILRRLATGRTKWQIAAELTLSCSTLHTHTVHGLAARID